MRISAEAPYLLTDIQKTINDERAGILITGGEPTVSRHFEEALTLLNDLFYPIANVETNGYNIEELMLRLDHKKPVKIMYSPKIFNEADLKKAMELSEKLFSYTKVYFKIVWQDGFTDAYCEWLSSQVKHMTTEERIWLMPEGSTRADLIRNSEKVFDACEKYKFNFSSRSHIIYDFV